jgi:hypothetical protein
VIDNIAILLPTRERPVPFSISLQSCLDNSTADILVYIDQDDPMRADYIVSDNPRVKTYFGRPQGKINAVNALYKKHPDYRAYFPSTDDMTFDRNDWQPQAMEMLDSFGDDIGIVSLQHHDEHRYANWEVIPGRWASVLGWIYFPELSFYCPDTIIQILAQAVGRLRYVTPKAVSHNIIHRPDVSSRFQLDCVNFLWYCANEFGDDLEKLRTAMRAQ